MTIVSAVICLMFLGLVYRLLLRGRSRRPLSRPTSPEASNTLLMLAALNVASLGYELISTGSHLRVGVTLNALIMVIPVLLIALIVLFTVNGFLGEVVLGVLGGLSVLVEAVMQAGTAGLLTVAILGVLVLFLLGAARGVGGALR